MTPAPIVIKCECGIETRGRTGDVIKCQGCGLRYDTEAEAQRLEMVAALTQRRFKLLSRMGIGLVGLLALVGFFTVQMPGMIVGAALGVVLWFVLLMPYMKRRLLHAASQIYKPIVTASRK